jgi:isochorismate pyruvate lyase
MGAQSQNRVSGLSAAKPAVAAADCRTMTEVRAEIDRLDQELVRLMAARQAYIEAAARIKLREDEVRLEWRVDDVLAKVGAAAKLEGLSQRIAEPVWRELVDRCIDHERETWIKIRMRNDRQNSGNTAA